MNDIQALINKLEEERAVLLDATKPLHSRRAALVARIQPLEAELRDVDRQIKEMERPRIVELGKQIAALYRTLPKTRTLKNDG